MTKVLVVDDEEKITRVIRAYLEREGFAVTEAGEGSAALRLAQSGNYDLVILDLMLPGLSGEEICRQLRGADNQVPIIMLTAKGAEEEKIRGLGLGADDYMVKPFSFEELLARIHARIRNQFPNLFGEVAIGPFFIDDRRKEIRLENRVLELSPTEYELLKFLVINHGLVLSKAMILDKVWGYDFGGEENIVEVYIRSLREKLNDKSHKLIRTMRGSGYRVDLS